MPLRSLVLGLFLILSGTVLAAQTTDVERLALQISEGRFKAATELQQISLHAGPSLRPTPGEEKVLRLAVHKARSFLSKSHPPEQLDSARQALCLARAYLPEELPGTEVPLRVGEDGRPPYRPKVIGKAVQYYPEVARRSKIQGTVILEAVIDAEGCVRRPKILKGLPMGLDGAALAAVRSWACRPSTYDGRPVPVYYILTVSFRTQEPIRPLAQPDPFERISELASQGRFKEAAKELHQIAEKRIEPGPAEMKLLRRAVEAARPALQGADGKAAQQVFCTALSYLPEDTLGSGEPIRSLGAGRPEVISKVAAHRTEPARKAGVQGTVILEVVIDSEGCVRNTKVLRGLPLGLDRAAIAAVRRWFFKPARLNGRPVAVYYVIPVPFSAKE